MSKPRRAASAPVFIIDDLIRRGRLKAAHRALLDLTPRKLPRENLAAIAGLARRVFLSDWALALLHPYVRPSGTKAALATRDEVLEYAANLTRVGAIQEARDLLTPLVNEPEPRVALYLSFTHVLQWDYAASIPLLEKYLAAPDLDEYERLLGRINLAAAYVHERDVAHARPLLQQIKETALQRERFLLVGNALKLEAQLELVEKNPDRVKTVADEALRYLSQADGQEAFLVRKLKAFADVQKNPGRATAWKGWDAIRAEALENSHWETVRDCDRLRAVTKQDTELFAKLWFGTPFLSFRRQLCADFGQPAPQAYAWNLRPGKKLAVLDLAAIETSIPQRRALGEVPYRLLRTLTSDFYRPFTTAYLYSQLYAGEFYNPNTSPARLKMSLLRLRQWLKSRRLPVAITFSDRAYGLTATKPVQVLVGASQGQLSKNAASLAALERRFADQPFSTTEAAKILRFSRRSAQRVLDEALNEAGLKRVGQGPATRYVIRRK